MILNFLPMKFKVASIICLSLNLFLIGCVDTKHSECNQVIEVTLNMADKTKNLYQQRDTKDSQKALQLADAFDEAVLSLKNLEIQDQNLVTYQNGFATMYQGLSLSTRDFVAALNKKNLDNAKLAKQQLQKQALTEQQLLKGLTNYCKTN